MFGLDQNATFSEKHLFHILQVVEHPIKMLFFGGPTLLTTDKLLTIVKHIFFFERLTSRLVFNYF